jgi:xanthine dehydrogenase accessory factor
MNSAFEQIKQLILSNQVVVRVVIAEAKGSTPRDQGTSMLVWVNRAGKVETFDSIGGGYLEEKAIEIALLSIHQLYTKIHLQSFILGVELDQCCGGTVQLIWERFESIADIDWLFQTRSLSESYQKVLNLKTGKNQLLVQNSNLINRVLHGLIEFPQGTFLYETVKHPTPELWLFGAGHVATHLLKNLPALNFQVRCFDSRELILGKSVNDYQLEYPDVIFDFQPEFLELINSAPIGSYFLVMTHSHQLDFLICQKILRNDSFGFLGLIGSKTKSARFKKRLLETGLSKQVVNSLMCPIGNKYQFSKSPAVIAIEIMAKLLELQENQFMMMKERNSSKLFNSGSE